MLFHVCTFAPVALIQTRVHPKPLRTRVVSVSQGSRRDEYTFTPYSGRVDNTPTGRWINSGSPGGGSSGGESSPEGSSPRVGQAVDVVKNAYRAFDRRGTGRISAKVHTCAMRAHLLLGCSFRLCNWSTSRRAFAMAPEYHARHPLHANAGMVFPMPSRMPGGLLSSRALFRWFCRRVLDRVVVSWGAPKMKRFFFGARCRDVIDQDIAGFLEEHSARVSDDERRAIDEAVSVSVAQKLRCVFLFFASASTATEDGKRYAACMLPASFAKFQGNPHSSGDEGVVVYRAGCRSSSDNLSKATCRACVRQQSRIFWSSCHVAHAPMLPRLLPRRCLVSRIRAMFGENPMYSTHALQKPRGRKD